MSGARVAPSDPTQIAHRTLQSIRTPSGRTAEFALDGRWGEGDPALFHFHALWFSERLMGQPWKSYEMYRKPKFPASKGGEPSGWAALPFRIVSLNRAGYGRSTMGDVAPGDWTYGHFSEDVSAVADHLFGPGSAFAVFGGSSGGPHAVAAAALLPGRVTAVLSLSGDANYCPDTMPKGKKMNEKIADGSPVTYVDGTRLFHYGGPCGEGSCCCGCCCCCCCPAGTKADLRVEVKALSDSGIAYSAIRCPVLIYHGEKDDTTDPNCARYLASQIPTAKLTMMPDAGHVQLPPEIFDKAMEDLHAAAAAGLPGAHNAPKQQAMGGDGCEST